MPSKEKKPANRFLFYPMGFAAGLLNGLLGSGGGMAVVPMLRGLKVEARECHATSLAIIFPLAAISGFLYLRAGSFNFSDAVGYIPGGVLGAVFGAWLLPRVGSEWLHRIFGVVVLFAAVRLLTR